MSNNKQSMKLYTEEELRKHLYNHSDEFFEQLTPIEIPSDEEIESKYNKFIDTEIQLGFLKQEQGERLKWYYKTYFINNEQK